jgi:NAD(P)-dependent dehydrogenase (short-subunit alcohol dehydrogenase family)
MTAEHGDNVVALPCDLTDLPALTAVLAKARVAFGTLDLLVNNADVTTWASNTIAWVSRG